jgi:glycosyltransferase involved in cell wall biosynthesis
MKICWFGFLSKNFSWSIVAQNLSRELIKMGHEIDLFSTNGLDHFPDDLKPHLKGSFEEYAEINQSNFNEIITSKLNATYDMQLSYTSLKNFPLYFIRGDKNRFGIWNYETTILPKSFAKCYKSVDKVLPSSEFSKKIFSDNGIPADNQVVVPHGIFTERFRTLGKFPLKTTKKYKILVNIAQPHVRKNIPNILKAYGKAFTKKDDVCLVLKVSRKSPQEKTASIPFNTIYSDFRREYKNCAEIEIIDYFIQDIETLYNACDVVFSLSNCECFHMPSLEGVGANKIVISPRYGGQLDFLNDDNSVLIDGKIVRAPDSVQYWEPSPYASMFEPDVNKAAQALKDVINNYDDYYKKFSPKMIEIANEYTWENAAKKIVRIAK